MSAEEAKNFRYTDAQMRAIELANSGASDIMLFGGSRSGKTFVLTCMVCTVAQYISGIRIVILRHHLKDVRESVVMDTFPKAMRLRLGWTTGQIERCLNKNDLVFRHPNGSEIWFGGLEDKERADKILGKEYGLIYFNEVSQLSYDTVETAKTRLAMKIDSWTNKCFYDCNPPSKSHWAYKLFVQKVNPKTNTRLLLPDDYVCMKMNPQDNADNISSDYLDKQLGSLTGKNKLRFLYGEWTDDTENALWKRGTMIDRYRAAEYPDSFDRIVVGVDPATTKKENSDYTGIVVAAKKWVPSEKTYHYYVLNDLSLKGSPSEWAGAVCSAYRRYRADRVVAEVNQGGELVRYTINNLFNNIPITAVRATRNKVLRAEPIAALYERGLVHHIGEFVELEEEMCSYVGPEKNSSPDRMDALVWALTDLSGTTFSRTVPYSFV